jgi:condensin complex subunit 2
VQLVENLNTALQQFKGGGETSTIDFAKMNRNISIRELKEVMWQSFLKDLPTFQYEEMAPEIEDEDLPPSNAFSKIYAALEGLMEKIKHRKISMQSCFLTILHLANEKNLTLKSQKDDFLIFN